MYKIDWIIIVILVAFLLSGIFGCAILQSKKPVPIIPPEILAKPTVQLWQAAKESNWLVTISIIGIGVGIFIIFKGKEWGMGLIISCCAILFVTLAVARFAWWMALGGLIGSIGILYISILSKNKALRQIVKGGELFKKNVKSRNKINYKEAFNNAQIKAQKSKSTSKLVKKIKTKLKVKGEI